LFKSDTATLCSHISDRYEDNAHHCDTARSVESAAHSAPAGPRGQAEKEKESEVSGGWKEIWRGKAKGMERERGGRRKDRSEWREQQERGGDGDDGRKKASGENDKIEDRRARERERDKRRKREIEENKE
jgi:hypothetical protein